MSQTADRAIVAGVGGSATPDTVALWAASEANRRHVGLRLVYAVDPTGALSPAGTTRSFVIVRRARTPRSKVRAAMRRSRRDTDPHRGDLLKRE